MIWKWADAAWALLFLPVLVALFLHAARARQRVLSRFPHWLVRSGRASRGIVIASAFGIAWVASVIALMDPCKQSLATNGANSGQVIEEQILSESRGDEPILTHRLAHDVIILLDASASMGVADTRLGQARLDYAKEIIDVLVGTLRGQSVALYAFTSQLATVVPLTVDYLYTRLMLRQVGINEGDAAGTDLMEAFDGIGRRHARGGNQKARTVILFTDGGDTRLESCQGEERTQQVEALCSRLASEDTPFRVLTIGLGTHAGAVVPNVTFEGNAVRSSLDEPLLRRLSQIGGGAYFFANDYSSLALADRLIAHLQLTEDAVVEAEQVIAEVERTEQIEAPITYQFFFRFPLAVALIALSGAWMLESSHWLEQDDRQRVRSP